MKHWLAVVALTAPGLALATHPEVPAAAMPKGMAGPSMPMLVQPGDLKWFDVPDLGAGVKLVILRGNPDKGGELTMRALFPDGTRIPAHWHPKTENFAVLQGTFMLGLGDKYDESKLVSLPTGGYASIPKGVRHFAQAKGETILELNAVGPFKTMWVEPPPMKK